MFRLLPYGLAFIIVSYVLLGRVGGLLAARRVRRWVVSATKAVLDPYRLGQYESALQACEGLRLGGEVTSPYCFFRGANLAHLGRLGEAEVWLRRNIAMREKEKGHRHLAIGLTTLGHTMLQAGRYDEAQENFQASLRHFPQRGSGYRSMAELCLLRRDNPAEALRWATLAIEHEQADRGLTLELRRTNLGEDLATLAWATAAGTRNRAEVARLVSEAVDSVGSGSVAARAQVHYQSGRAYAELGDIQASAQYYGVAAKLDAQGNWGRAASTALTDCRAPDS